MKSPTPHTLLPLAATIASVFAVSPVLAEENAEDMEQITVTATRANRDINEIAANITVINSEMVDSLAANNIRDLLRYEPGVNVEGGGRFGLSNFNIRGINGDRVLILLDNVPVADGFSFGPNLSARRDFVDVDLIKGVEIIRGPASTLYGSDAIGGVVAFSSKDPIDMIEPGESFSGRVKAGYVSQSDETYINGQLAGVAGDFQWLLNAGYRDGSEVDTFYSSGETGENQRSANPQDNSVDNALFKLIWSPNDSHKLSFIGEVFNANADTNITSDVGATLRGRSGTQETTSSTGNDERERERISLHYSYQPGNSVLNRFTFNAYSQSSSTVQHSDISRIIQEIPGAGFNRTRDSSFDQDIHGVLSQADFQFSGPGEHYLVAGFEWQETDSEALREGETINFDGTPAREFSIFPARDFPISTLTEWAFYIQDEIQFMDGRLLVSPGVRFDSFKLEPELDALFVDANPGVAISEFDDSEVSAKLGAVYNITEESALWVQWAQGFRIPPMEDLNVGFTNFFAGYTSLANPDLMPETVDSIEFGVRQNINNFSFSISAYFNDYENFIESLVNLGPNRDTGLLEFQAQNIEDVEINGVDISATWDLDMWQIRLASSWQDSEDKSTGQELVSVQPVQTVLGVQYGRLEDPWRIELVGTHLDRANSFPPDENGDNLFVAPSAVLVDLLAHYQITDDIRLNAGIFNLTDEKYWFASEVVGRPENDNALDRLTAPGTNFSANIIYNF